MKRFLNTVFDNYKLSDAIRKSDLAAVNRLLKTDEYHKSRKIDNEGLDHLNPLQLAVSLGNLNIVKILHKAGARINMQNEKGETALYIAIQKNFTNIIEFLLENKADTNLATLEGNTPLLVAVADNNVDEVMRLLLFGANIDYQETAEGTTPLIRSIIQEYVEMTFLLLESGANPEQSDYYGNGPIHYAAMSSKPMLIYKLVSLNLDLNKTNTAGVTPLMLAAQANYEVNLTILLDSGKVYIDSVAGEYTALTTATERKNHTIVMLLLQRGAKTQHRQGNESFEKTPLYFAAKEGELELVKTLLAYDASPYVSTLEGTIIETAKVWNHMLVVGVFEEFQKNPILLGKTLRRDVEEKLNQLNESIANELQVLKNETASLNKMIKKLVDFHIDFKLNNEDAGDLVSSKSSSSNNINSKMPSPPTHTQLVQSDLKLVELPSDIVMTNDLLEHHLNRLCNGNSESRTELTRYFTRQYYCKNSSEYAEYKTRTFQYVQDKARNGNKYAQSFLGWLYYYGIGVEKSFAESKVWLEKAVNNQEYKAFVLLGYMYEQGCSVDRDIDYASKLYTEATLNGVASGGYYLALMHRSGKFGSKDDKLIVNHLEKSASLNDPGSMVLLAHLYQNGEGVQQDKEQAAFWYRKAVLNGHVLSAFRLAMLLLKGEGVKKNIPQALQYLEYAADRDQMNAQYKLALILKEGQYGVTKDLKRAFKLLNASAEQGLAGALSQLGSEYKEGKLVTKDYDLAIKYYKKAAAAGNMIATGNLAEIYYERKDYSTAMEWALKAKGNSTAQLVIGLMYKFGYGVPVNLSKAFEWFQKGAEMNSRGCLRNIADFYEKGLVVEQDLPTALKYFQRAGELGDTAACMRLATLYSLGEHSHFDVKADPQLALTYYLKIPEKKLLSSAYLSECIGDEYRKLGRYKDAFKWFKISADLGHKRAQYLLALLYMSGDGGIKDTEWALYWLKKSAEQDYTNAQSYLGLLYLEGDVVAANIPKAITLLVRAENAEPGITKDALKIAIDAGHQALITQEQLKLVSESAVQSSKSDEISTAASTESNNSMDITLSHNSSTTIVGSVDSAFSIDVQSLATVKVLGEGAYGKVFLGKWHGHTDVAIKVLKVSELTDTLEQDFKLEAQLMGRLRSPHIVQLYGVCFERPLRLVMEYLPNGSLFNLIHSSNEINWEQRISISLDVAKGLHYLHVQKPQILHRDFKSLNILLDQARHAKLTDFGLSQVKQAIKSTTMKQSAATQSVGTLAWMAPELFNRKPRYSTASDIYSMGVVFWELASRKIPFNDAADASLISVWVKDGEREEIPSETPASYAKLIENCWKQRSEDRLSINEVLTALNSFSENKESTSSDNSLLSPDAMPDYTISDGALKSGPSYDFAC